ncbi:MAG: stage II sporulation protein D [Bacillota bacterium]
MQKRRRTRHACKKRRQKKLRILKISAVLLALALILWGIAAYITKDGQATEKGGTTPKPESTFVPLGVPILVYDHERNRTVEMDLEMYTFNAMSGEMPAGYELEALKAQAVATRTLAVYKMEGHPCGRSGDAAVCTDSTHCQAYVDDATRRKNWGANYEAYCAKLWQAVNATRGEIITYAGEPIEVFFHSTSGGQTEDAQNVFSHGEPYLVSVSSAGEENAPRYKAAVSIPRGQFASKINNLYASAHLTASSLEKNVSITSRYASGRVKTMAAGGATLTGQQMRSLFSLNSTNFTLSFTGGNVVIETLGYGHGVGMSQVGANAMAQKGDDYKTILTHYFQGVEIQKHF